MKTKRPYRTASVLIICLCGIFSLGSDCSESLPLYEEPARVFDLALYTTEPSTSALRYQTERIVMNKAGFSFTLLLRCLFDETLQGDMGRPLGKLDIWWDENPDVTTTLDITYDTEMQSQLFSPYLPVTLDPGDSAFFLVVWRDFKTENGVNLWEYGTFDRLTSDDLHTYYNYKPMSFTAEAWIQPIENGPVIRSEELPFAITFYSIQSEEDTLSVARPPVCRP
ncbi:hypothetical protein JXO52_16855 [bacterium]|nr:hypothetical protein [bacterium]